MFKVFILSIVL